MGIPTPGSQTPAAGDLANAVVSGTIGSATHGDPFTALGPFNVTVWGTFVATWGVQKCFDGGTTWIPFVNYALLTPPDGPLSIIISEPEAGVAYRVNVSAYTSGTLSYRLSTTGAAAGAWGVIQA